MNYEYPPLGGGAANANAYLLKAYANNPDISVDLITSSPDSEEHIITISDRIHVYTLPVGKTAVTLHHQSQKELLTYSYRAYKLASQFLQKNEYDVVHAFFGIPCGVVAMVLKKKYKVPYLVSLRGADVPGYSERFSLIYTFLTPLTKKVWYDAKKVVSNSQGLKELALRSAPEQAISVIPNGVDTEKFSLGAVSSEEWIITAGATRLTERKGLHLIIEALPELALLQPNIMFEIMGDGSATESLQQLAKDLGVERHVRFLGRIDASETTSYYQRARVFVLPSANEGMSNALLEALACGLPVVVTDTGGSSELVEEGVNGFIIAREASAIVEALKKLLNNEALRIQMGGESRVRAEQQSWHSVADQYVELYQGATKEKL